MASPRQVGVNITYIPKGCETARTATTMANYLEDFEYVDASEGESDTVSATFSNINLQWCNTWLPVIGDKMEVQIVTQSWSQAGDSNIFDCGKFCVDDLKYEGPNLKVELGGVSVPESQDFHCTERTYTWQMVTLQEMAAAIAERYALTLVYDADIITIESLEQDSKTDSDFLKETCESYGLYLKVYYGQLIIYDINVYEDKPAVAIYDIGDFQQWDCQHSLTGTYTGAVMTYTKEDDDTEISVGVGTPGRILNLNEKCDSDADAMLKAIAAVNEENRSTVTMSATIKANLNIVAGCCIEITNAYDLNGKYFVEKVTHSIDSGSAYTMDLEMHKVQEKITLVVPDPMSLFIAALMLLMTGDAVAVTGTEVTTEAGVSTLSLKDKLYITEIKDGDAAYPYGLAKRKGGKPVIWAKASSLTKIEGEK